MQYFLLDSLGKPFTSVMGPEKLMTTVRCNMFHSTVLSVSQGQMVTGMVDKSVLFLCYPALGCFLSRRNAFYVGDLPPGPLKHTVIALICLKNSLVEHSLDLVSIYTYAFCAFFRVRTHLLHAVTL